MERLMVVTEMVWKPTSVSIRSITQEKVEYSSRIWVMTLSWSISWFLMENSAQPSTLRSRPSGMPTNTMSRR